ncbi:uncharacterized protein LOC110451143, partial [Mizuhopecten yessoensis]|uniref:uncharacterized protein LOC110451143 n=1 Tax=Mizuhopecten yessoensis TaxID=6573 RepID=UPI000B457FEA
MLGLRYTCVFHFLCLHVLLCYCDPPTTTPMVQLGVTDQPTTSHTTASTAPRVDLAQRRQYMLHMIRQNFMREMGWNTLPTIDASVVERPQDLRRYVQDLTMETQTCYAAS